MDPQVEVSPGVIDALDTVLLARGHVQPGLLRLETTLDPSHRLQPGHRWLPVHDLGRGNGNFQTTCQEDKMVAKIITKSY